MKNTLVLLGCAMIAISSSGQQPASPAGVQATTGTKSGEFFDKDIDIHFNYPVEMQILDAAQDMESGHFNLYGASADNDPEHQQAKRCVRPLLDLVLPEDKAPKRNADMGNLWIDDTKEYKESRAPEPIYAKILFTELVKDCLPKKLQKNENDTLGTMALSAVTMPGLERAPNPLWYDVANQKIHMNNSIGRPLVNGKPSPAPIIVMSMSTQWHGHLLLWVFMSNDMDIFNDMTKSLVQFGKGPWGQMFAANIGPKDSGTPMTILPK